MLQGGDPRHRPARHHDRPHARDRASTCVAARWKLAGDRLRARGHRRRRGRSGSRERPRAVAIEVADGAGVLVGPDNGLLAPAVAVTGGATPVRLDNPAFRLAAPGATFAGRDVFAPAAAHLCNGVDLGRLGWRSTRPACSRLVPLPRHDGRRAACRGVVGRPVRQLSAQRRPRRARRARRRSCHVGWWRGGEWTGGRHRWSTASAARRTSPAASPNSGRARSGWCSTARDTRGAQPALGGRRCRHRRGRRRAARGRRTSCGRRARRPRRHRRPRPPSTRAAGLTVRRRVAPLGWPDAPGNLARHRFAARRDPRGRDHHAHPHLTPVPATVTDRPADPSPVVRRRCRRLGRCLGHCRSRSARSIGERRACRSRRAHRPRLMRLPDRPRAGRLCVAPITAR